MLSRLKDMADEALECIKTVLEGIVIFAMVTTTFMFAFLFFHPAGWAILILLVAKFLFN